MKIEHGLRHRRSIKKIAAKIGQRHSTLAREIRARSVPSDKGALGRLTHRGLRRRSWDRRQLCEERNSETSCASATTCPPPPTGDTAPCSSAPGRARTSPNGDMPRVCSLKPRSSRKPVEHTIATQCRRGHTYRQGSGVHGPQPPARLTERDNTLAPPPLPEGWARICCQPEATAWNATQADSILPTHQEGVDVDPPPRGLSRLREGARKGQRETTAVHRS